MKENKQTLQEIQSEPEEYEIYCGSCFYLGRPECPYYGDVNEISEIPIHCNRFLSDG